MPSARAFLVRERDGSGRVIARYTNETERTKSEPRAHEGIVSVQKVPALLGPGSDSHGPSEVLTLWCSFRRSLDSVEDAGTNF